MTNYSDLHRAVRTEQVKLWCSISGKYAYNDLNLLYAYYLAPFTRPRITICWVAQGTSFQSSLKLSTKSYHLWVWTYFWYIKVDFWKSEAMVLVLHVYKNLDFSIQILIPDDIFDNKYSSKGWIWVHCAFMWTSRNFLLVPLLHNACRLENKLCSLTIKEIEF